MIEFSVLEQDRLIGESIDHFARDHLQPFIREAEKNGSPTEAVRNAFNELGIDWLEIPEAMGGSGCGSLSRLEVNSRFGQYDPGAFLALDRIGPALYPIALMGGADAVSEHILPLLQSSDQRIALVTTHNSQLQFSTEEISGVIPWIPCDRIDKLVIIHSDSCFVLDSGFSLTTLRGSGLRAAGANEVVLKNAPLASCWVDKEESARALAKCRLYIGALLLGVLQQINHFTRDYARERKTFGKPIAHHQAMAFLITDMNTAVVSAKLLLEQAAWQSDTSLDSSLDSPLDYTTAAAVAYAEVIEAANFVGPAGVQILGGHGFMQDYPVEKYMREAKALTLLLGGIDAAREDAGRFFSGPSFDNISAGIN
jgi:alkylation response protein AidB-like acyl-CoA dehydrogenase